MKDRPNKEKDRIREAVKETTMAARAGVDCEPCGGSGRVCQDCARPAADCDCEQGFIGTECEACAGTGKAPHHL